MCSRRHDTQRKPYPAVGGEGKRRQLVVDKDFLSLVENVEIVGDIPVLTLIDRYIVEESESGFVERQKHRLLIFRHIAEIETIAQLLHLFRRHSAQKHRIGRYIQEVLPEIVDDIDALIRRARKRLSRADILIHTAVIKLLGEPDLVIGYEEIVGPVCHHLYFWHYSRQHFCKFR